MRRVSATNASPGMVIGRAVFDSRGRLVLAEGDKLSQDSLELLARSGASQILVEDPRVADVLVGSLYSAQLEAKAVQSLNVLLALQQGSSSGVTAQDLLGTQPWIRKMAERLYPDILGDPELSGQASLQGYDHIHPVKVAGLAMLIGRVAGLELDKVVQLGMAAMVQNVGYLPLPQAIFEKDGEINIDEREQIRKHPQLSANMLAESGLEPEVIEAVAQHHERWNGSGYPEGRKGEEISFFARIIGLADTFHALLSKRPYRPAFKPHEAVEYIVAFSGEFFDAKLATIFARKVPQYPAGLGVKLSTGEVGIISDPNTGQVARPIVRICYEGGEKVDEPYDLDLAHPKCMNKLIVEVVL